MQTDTLHTEPPSRHSHTLVPSDRVEGTPVRRANGEKIGTIQRLMIDKLSGSVAYAVLSFGGFLGMGQKHAPIPWARLKYDPTLGAYQLELSNEELSGAPSIAANEEFDWGDRSREIEIHFITGCLPIGARISCHAPQRRQAALARRTWPPLSREAFGRRSGLRRIRSW